MVKIDVWRDRLGLFLTLACTTFILAGCATGQGEPFEERLAAMSDAQLVSYYGGINDRIKEIQAGTRADDQRRAVRQDDHLARMPYIAGGEAWNLEQKQTKVYKEMMRRGLQP